MSDQGVSLASDDADEWVAATGTRNHVLGDPLMDWLELCGETKGYQRDEPDERTDYGTFATRRGRQFESAVMRWLRSLDIGEVLDLPASVSAEASANENELAFATATAMSEGVPIIAQGVLCDHQSKTYGSPDLLLRSGIFLWLFPGHLPEDTVFDIPAPKLDIGDEHYVVVDIKYATLHLNAAGMLGNAGSAPAYKAQMFVYNRALAETQGYLPPNSFVLGRRLGNDTPRRNRSPRQLSRSARCCRP